MKRALITGGAGFIGSHLAESLLHQGWAVDILDDLSTGRLANVESFRSHARCEVTIDSILDRPTLDRLVLQADVVYHLAAAVGVRLVVEDPVRVIETNVLGAQCVLEAALRHRTPVLLASTSEVYGKSEAVPAVESADRLLGPTTNPRWCYSTSKAIDEYLGLAYHREKGLPVVIARLFNTIGPRQTGEYGMVVPRFVAQALADEPLTVYGDGQQSRAFCDVSDTVRALTGLMSDERAEGGIFNVGSTRETRILDLARTVLSLVDRSKSGNTVDKAQRIELVPFETAYAEGFEDLQRRIPDIRRIRRLLDWEPRITLEESLERIINSAQAAAGSSG